MDYATKDRRRAPRAQRILSIQYRLLKSKYKSDDRKWYLSTTYDMSVVGVAFLSDVPYHIGDILEIHVIMSGILDIFKGKAEVVRIERKATGASYLIAIKLLDNEVMAQRKSSSKQKSKRIGIE
ncbi:MAG: PilZ domain-containing protein [Candidatus Omnitrophica bacterium]|nr:PilZ domain-containing protein [Candidatus Omnitrophota bacterium]